MLFQHRGILGILGQVVELVGVFFEIVELFFRACLGTHVGGLERRHLPVGVSAAQFDDAGMLVTVLGLVESAVGQVIANVAKAFRPDCADAIDGDATAIAGGDDEFLRLVVCGKEVVTFKRSRNL